MNKNQISAFFETLRAINPNPKTELNYTNEYTLLVAVVLSAQMTDKGVNKATEKLFALADSPQKMISLGEAVVLENLKTINLYKTKTKNVLALSQILVEKYGGTLPNTREELESLPGVGRKTANVVLNVAFGLPTMAVDTHIFRVSNRTGLAKGKTPLEVEEKLLKRVPQEFLEGAHHWLILHGRYVCKAQNPNCKACPVKDYCDYFKKQPSS
jgi:endonuclease-3